MSKMRRPVANGGDDGGEVVVEEHKSRGFTRDLGAALAHRDPYIRALKRRRVIYAVAGDGNNLTLFSERLD